MNRFANFLENICKIIRFIEIYGCLLLLVEMVIIVFFGVLTRYFSKGQIPWAAELASYSLAWFTFLGASIVSDRKEHLAIKYFVEQIPFFSYYKKTVNILVFFLEVVCLAILIYGSFVLVVMSNMQLSAAMQIPLSWAYMSILAGSTFMLMHILEHRILVYLK